MNDVSSFWVFLFALTGRILDVFSTWLVTPSLGLEGNFIVRRFGWPFAFATFFSSLLTFVAPAYGVIIGTASCVMAFSNMHTAVLVRKVGGEGVLTQLLAQNARSLNWRRSLFETFLLPLPVLIMAFMLFAIAGVSMDNLVADVAYGIVTYGLGVAFHRTRGLVRVYLRLILSKRKHA